MLACFQKTTSTTADKSFAIGCMAETLHEMGSVTAVFCHHLFPVFMANVIDEDEEVRSNSIFGLGVLAANGGEVMYPYPCTETK